MRPAQIFATPSLMVLISLIGGAMREAGSVAVWTQLALVGAIVPQVGSLLKAWMMMEEQFGDDVPWHNAPSPEDESGELRSGWISQDGPVWRWRHVAETGIVLVVLSRWFVVYGSSQRLPRLRVWQPAASLVAADLSQIRDEPLA